MRYYQKQTTLSSRSARRLILAGASAIQRRLAFLRLNPMATQAKRDQHKCSNREWSRRIAMAYDDAREIAKSTATHIASTNSAAKDGFPTNAKVYDINDPSYRTFSERAAWW